MVVAAIVFWAALVYAYVRCVRWTSEHVRHDVLVAIHRTRGRE